MQQLPASAFVYFSPTVFFWNKVPKPGQTRRIQELARHANSENRFRVVRQSILRRHSYIPVKHMVMICETSVRTKITLLACSNQQQPKGIWPLVSCVLASSALAQCDIPTMGMLLQPSVVAVMVGLSMAISGRSARPSVCRPVVTLNPVWNLAAAPALPRPGTSEAASWSRCRCIARRCLQWRAHPFLDTVLQALCP
jgi:hypothetical protein